MDIPVNAEVTCADGPCGRSACLIVKPGTETVTHVVVKEKRFPNEEFLVPLEAVVQATADSIELRYSRKELREQQPFVVTEYVKSKVWRYAGGDFLYEPFQYQETEQLPISHESVPFGEVTIHRGAQVEATDGTVGRVDGFLVNRADGQITHLVMREGHLWAPREVTIPVTQIDRVGADEVYLTLDKRGVEALPAVRSHSE